MNFCTEPGIQVSAATRHSAERHYHDPRGGRLGPAVVRAATGLLLGCALFAPAQAAPALYRFDPHHTQVHWEVLHFGASTSRGRITDIGGHLAFDRHSGEGEVSLRIGTASNSTGVRPLDAVLRGAYYFDVAQHPEAWFVSGPWRVGPDGQLTVRGELTVRGVSQAVSLHTARLHCRPPTDTQREVCGGDFTGELRRSDFGITHGLPFVGDRVRLVIQVEAERLPDPVH